MTPRRIEGARSTHPAEPLAGSGRASSIVPAAIGFASAVRARHGATRGRPARDETVWRRTPRALPLWQWRPLFQVQVAPVLKLTVAAPRLQQDRPPQVDGAAASAFAPVRPRASSSGAPMTVQVERLLRHETRVSQEPTPMARAARRHAAPHDGDAAVARPGPAATGHTPPRVLRTTPAPARPTAAATPASERSFGPEPSRPLAGTASGTASHPGTPPAVDIARVTREVTREVVRAIDQRIVAHRERLGRG